jgi:hypothetical protein
MPKVAEFVLSLEWALWLIAGVTVGLYAWTPVVVPAAILGFIPLMLAQVVYFFWLDTSDLERLENG